MGLQRCTACVGVRRQLLQLSFLPDFFMCCQKCQSTGSFSDTKYSLQLIYTNNIMGSDYWQKSSVIAVLHVKMRNLAKNKETDYNSTIKHSIAIKHFIFWISWYIPSNHHTYDQIFKSSQKADFQHRGKMIGINFPLPTMLTFRVISLS